MKGWIKVGIVLIIIILLSPLFYFAAGLILERTLRQDLHRLYGKDGYFTGDLVDYNRGWFSSKANLQFRLNVPNNVAKDNSVKGPLFITFPLMIHHGPIYYANSRLFFGFGFATTTPELEADVDVDYLNQSHFRFGIPAVSFVIESELFKTEWLGFSMKQLITTFFHSLEGEVILGGFNFKQGSNQFELGKIYLDYDFSHTKEYKYLTEGEAEFNLHSLLVSDDQKNVFQFSNFDIQFRNEIEGEFVDFFHTIAIDEVKIQDKTYGPGLLKIDVKHLDAKSLDNMWGMNAGQAIQNLEQGSDQVESGLALMAFIYEIPKTISRGAEINISEFNLMTPNGKVEGNLKASVLPGLVYDPSLFLKNLNGEGTFKLPIALAKKMLQSALQQNMNKPSNLQQALVQQMQQTTAGQSFTSGDIVSALGLSILGAQTTAQEQAEQQLQTMEKSGLLKIEGDYYLATVKVQDGKLTVNGDQTFDLNSLFQ